MTKNLIVGEKDCEINDIANILKDDDIIMREWRRLGWKLGVSGAEIEKHRLDLQLDKLMLCDIIQKILDNWTQRNGSQATLIKLVECMDALEWYHISDQLLRRYDITSEYNQSLTALQRLRKKYVEVRPWLRWVARAAFVGILSVLFTCTDVLKWYPISDISEQLSKHYGTPYVRNEPNVVTEPPPRKFGVDDPVDLFTGRHDELEELHEKLTGSSSTNSNTTVITQRAAISGLGGIGKTELAKQYIYLYGNHFNNILWINAESEPSIQENFKSIATDELSITQKNADGVEKDIFTIIKQVYRALEGSKILVVFDNAEMPIKTFRKYLPPSQLGQIAPTILLTSRNREWNFDFKINIISIDELKMKDGIELVKKGLNLINDDQTDQIKELLNMLQCFPLAIQQAISYINENVVVHGSYSIVDYMDQFKRSNTELLNSDVFQESNKYTQTTLTTWNVTMKSIESNKNYGNLSCRILDIIGYMSPDKITHNFFISMNESVSTVPDIEQKVTIDKVNNAIRLLVKYSMLKRISDTSVSVHRLVQEVTRIRLRGAGKEYSILEEAVELLSNADKNDLPEQGPTIWKYAQQHTQVVKTHSEIPLKIILALHDGYKYGEAYIYYKETIDKLKEVLTESHKITLFFQDLNARYLHNIGRGDEGLSILKHVVEKQKQILGSEHPDTLTTMHNMASMLDKQGKSDEALSMFKEVWEKRKQILGSEHPNTLATMNSMASVLDDQGKSDEALSMFKEVWEKRKQNLGSDHPDTLTTMHFVAFALNEQGESDEALSMFKEVLEKEKKILGADHPNTLTTMHYVAFALNEQGKADEALSMLNEVLEEEKQIRGADHPNTLATMHSMARVLDKQGKSDEALSIYEEVWEKRKQN